MTPTSGKKTRVGVLFGGRSTEHEVSISSGKAIMSGLERDPYGVLPIFVTEEGRWLLLPDPSAPPEEGREVFLPARPGKTEMIFADGGGTVPVDVLFPMIHGTFGEDGTLQGLFELAGVPFVGAGCTASAVAMDKAIAKAILRAAGLPVVPSITLTRSRWKAGAADLAEEAASKLGFPLFVKPASLGSSVGVHRVEGPEALEAAIADAMEYDVKVLLEEDARGREIECAVIEGPEVGQILASPVAEIRPKKGWYDYRAKYTPGLTEIIIPADLDPAVADRIRAHARAAFTALGSSGLARVDCFFRERTGEIYLSELNTLPGFTPLSGYPKMLAEGGISYTGMLDRLIACAFSREELSRSRRFRRRD